MRWEGPVTEATDENAADEAQLTWAGQAVSQIVTMAWHLRARIGEPVEERVRDAVLALVTQRSPRAKAELIRSDPALAGNEVELLLDTAAEVCRQMPGSDPSWPRFFMSHLDIVRLVRVEELRPED